MNITLKEYQKIALERLNPTIVNKDKESMRFCCMGLLEESGEIIAELRKPLFKGNYHEKSLDKHAIASELGDLIWYMALVCKNNDIDIENIQRKEKENEKEEDRETLIKKGIKIGQTSGKIAQKYIDFYKGKIKKEKLEKSLRKQYKNILKLSEELNIPMQDILQINIEKVNGRYDKNGKSTAGLSTQSDNKENEPEMEEKNEREL